MLPALPARPGLLRAATLGFAGGGGVSVLGRGGLDLHQGKGSPAGARQQCQGSGELLLGSCEGGAWLRGTGAASPWSDPEPLPRALSLGPPEGKEEACLKSPGCPEEPDTTQLKGSTMLHMEKDLNELLVWKEQEWKELQARQLHFQKTMLQDSRKQLQEIQKKFNRLKEDFTYNLKVLDERDRELEHYDAMFAHLKTREHTKEAEVSELRIQLDKLQEKLDKETHKQENLQYQYQQKLKEHRLALEQLQSSKNNDIHQHREEYVKLKQQLENKLQEVEGELVLQKQELLAEFDAEMKKRELEFQQREDETSNLVLSHKLKVNLLSRELEVLKDAGMKAAESLQMAERTNLRLEKELKCKDWEFKDLAAVKDARIKELEGKLHSMNLMWKKEEETFRRKHEVLDRFAKEKEAVLASVKEAHAEQVQKWENHIRELQISHENLETELRRSEWSQADCLREKDAFIENTIICSYFCGVPALFWMHTG
ncbi:coiled-coil domain-containing protein 57-like isoform X2 [Alligator sinensis]|uniref:Coiled-coil domain-containing protein 57-like isoform X2 n=1 Tax=Alligator sinensis TaxID=38654 RepID=A0A3Q0FUD9_ALLSI|nr:coiled-coil domain-containing protein 57-like isoform X2 [Alligator sinensis]